MQSTKHKMTHGSLFSGIGGFDLAAEWMGWDNLFHCEINPFSRRHLKYYWPNAKSYGNITEADFTIYRNRIDVLSGGFPCQPFSHAGSRLGSEDERHLWPEMCRAIREIRPKWIVGENVFGIINWSKGLVFEQVQTDLEAEGYEVQSYVLPAASVGAPHQRQRLFIVAYSKSDTDSGNTGEVRKEAEKKDRNGFKQGPAPKQQIQLPFEPNTLFGHATDPDFKMLEGGDGKGASGERANSQERIKSFDSTRNWDAFPTQPPICSRNDGFPDKLDGITFSRWRNESLRAYGNAVVPQLPYVIYKTIEAYEQRGN